MWGGGRGDCKIEATPLMAMGIVKLLLVYSFLQAPVLGERVISALKKSHHSYNVSEKVLDIVDVVEGYHPDAISVVFFNNSINDTG